MEPTVRVVTIALEDYLSGHLYWSPSPGNMAGVFEEMAEHVVRALQSENLLAR